MENDIPVPEDVRLIGSPEQLGALFEALSQAQGEFASLGKEATAEVKSREGKFLYNFDYCPLDAVIAATQPALTKYKLAIMQLSNGNYLLTILACGQARIESRIGLPPWETPQQLGALLTYFKRYSRLGLLSVFPAGEDDDGNAASGNIAKVSPRPAARPPERTAEPAKPRDAVTDETKARVKALGAQAGLTMAELQAFSVKHACGELVGMTEASGVRLIGELQKLQVQT